MLNKKNYKRTFALMWHRLSPCSHTFAFWWTRGPPLSANVIIEFPQCILKSFITIIIYNLSNHPWFLTKRLHDLFLQGFLNIVFVYVKTVIFWFWITKSNKFSCLLFLRAQCFLYFLWSSIFLKNIYTIHIHNITFEFNSN